MGNKLKQNNKIMEDLIVAFYTKDRYPALIKAINSLDESTPYQLPILVIEDQPKGRLNRNLSKLNLNRKMDFVYGESYPGNKPSKLNIVELPSKSSCAHLMNLCFLLSGDKYRYVMSCNDDLVFKKGWFEHLEKAIKDGYEYILLHNHGAWVLDKKVLPKLGYFDERFQGGNCEDADLIARAQRTDIKILNLWEEVPQKGLIIHEPFYYSSACWDGSFNCKYFAKKWNGMTWPFGTNIKKQIEDVDWFPSLTEKWKNENEKIKYI